MVRSMPFLKLDLENYELRKLSQIIKQHLKTFSHNFLIVI